MKLKLSLRLIKLKYEKNEKLWILLCLKYKHMNWPIWPPKQKVLMFYIDTLTRLFLQDTIRTLELLASARLLTKLLRPKVITHKVTKMADRAANTLLSCSEKSFNIKIMHCLQFSFITFPIIFANLPAPHLIVLMTISVLLSLLHCFAWLPSLYETYISATLLLRNNFSWYWTWLVWGSQDWELEPLLYKILLVFATKTWSILLCMILIAFVNLLIFWRQRA